MTGAPQPDRWVDGVDAGARAAGAPEAPGPLAADARDHAAERPIADIEADADDAPDHDGHVRRPVYARALRLRHVRLRTWQRVLLGDGSLLLAVLLVLADLVSAWALVVLPLAVAAVVKAHDLTAAVLARPVHRSR